MGVVDELARAREAYERRDWVAAYGALSDADATTLTAADLDRLATAAILLGRRNDSIAALQRAHRVSLDAGDPLGAVRAAFHLAMTLHQAGEHAVGAGWAARGRGLLDEVDADVVERGYVHAHDCYACMMSHDHEAALRHAQEAVEHGRRFGDANLVAMGTCAQGRLAMMAGDVRRGLDLLDEAMVWVATGDLTPVFAGEVYCTTIEGCQDVGDVGRAEQWTLALTRWCDAQPDLVMFTGQCAVHRGQIMRLHGAFPQAAEEFERACERYRLADLRAATGLALAERGDVARVLGDAASAEAAYAAASATGHDPQPGRTLLWLASGRTEAAVGAVRRLLAETPVPVLRWRLLPAAVDVLVAGGEVDEAARAAAELEGLAGEFGVPALAAAADNAVATVLLEQGDAAGALVRLRSATRVWGGLDAPYEQARCRLLVARALEVLGDGDSARLERADAEAALTRLGVWLPAASASPGGLSQRELEVLRLVAAGRSNAEIAAALVLSEKTVARHLSNIFAKLDVVSRTAAAAYAYEHGLLTPA